MSLSTIFDQIVQLGQYNVVSQVNTGDKVLDSTINVTVGSIISYTACKVKAYATSWFTKRSKKQEKDKKKKIQLRKKRKLYRSIDQEVMPTLVQKHGTFKTSQYWYRLAISDPPLRDAWITEILKMYPEAGLSNLRNRDGVHQLNDFLPSPSTKDAVGMTLYNAPVWWMGGTGDVVVANRTSKDRPLFFLSDNLSSLKSWIERFKDLIAQHPNAFESTSTLLTVKSTGSKKTLHLGDLMKWFAGISIDEAAINSRWTLDCMVCRHKPELEGFLRRYEEGIKSVNPFGCQKMGLLLSSAPGCGKSSLVSALANHLQKDVLSVDLTQIDDKDAFAKAIRKATSNGHIILFDEFDLLLKNMLSETNNKRQRERQQQLREIKENMAAYKSMEVSTEQLDEEKKRFAELMQSTRKAPIDLAFLLSLLDGVGETPGRIIVATTNHPELIPASLLRPGRFDLKIAMGYFSNQEVKDLLTRIFKEHQLPLSDFSRLQQDYTFPDDVWSPAEILCQYHVFGDLFTLANHLRAFKFQPLTLSTATLEEEEDGNIRKKRKTMKQTRFLP